MYEIAIFDVKNAQIYFIIQKLHVNKTMIFS